MAQNGKLRIIANYTSADIAGSYVNPMQIELGNYYGFYRPPSDATQASIEDADAAMNANVQPQGPADLERFDIQDINDDYLDKILAIDANKNDGFEKAKLIVVRLELTKNNDNYNTYGDHTVNRIYITKENKEQVYKSVNTLTGDGKRYYGIKIVNNKLTILDSEGNVIPIDPEGAITLAKLISKLLGTEITIATGANNTVTQSLVVGGKKSKKHRRKGGKKSKKRRSMRRLKRSRARK